MEIPGKNDEPNVLIGVVPVCAANDCGVKGCAMVL